MQRILICATRCIAILVSCERIHQWAVVIGGNPTVAYADGCTTSETGINNAGLWLFSRSPVASDATMAAMRALLTAQNISQSRLHTVPHDGCKYAGAVLK